MKKRIFARVIAVLVFVLGVWVAAQETARADDPLLDLKNRLERLEQQNEELRQKLTPTPATAPATVSPQILTTTQNPDTPAAAGSATVSKSELPAVNKTPMKVLWDYGLVAESENKAFRVHVGGRTQIDAVWVHANQKLMTPTSTGGIGEFDDGVNFRRARFVIDGTFWEAFDFACEYDFVNTFRFVPSGDVVRVPDANGNRTLNPQVGTVADRQNIANTPVPTDFWIQWKNIPYLGTIRVGNQKAWLSFEHMTSSRWLDFMERSYAFDAFVEDGDNGFVPGISVFSTLADDRFGYAAGVYKANTVDIFGWNVGDGEYMFTGRLWGTPIYQSEGRYLLHTGLSYTHRGADDGRVRYRARPMLRNGNAVLHNSTAIAQLQGRSENILIPEIALVCGAFNLSAEWFGTWVDLPVGNVFQNVAGQATNALPANLRGGLGQLFYHGGYVTVGYFLTGESRSYSKKQGSWDRQKVNEYAVIHDEENGYRSGSGAWEILARYGYLDLSDKGVNGGIINSLTLGLNWHWNSNAKVQFNYEIANRNVTQYVAGRIPPGGLTARDGVYQEFGTRFAFDF
jgi:phosphate-selective porin OprO/OprP